MSSRAKLVVVTLLFHLNGAVGQATIENDPEFERQWNMRMIGAPSAWPSAAGGGITIAIVDSGVELAHPDLGPRVVPGANLVEPNREPDDDHGHGTHVAGIAAAVAHNGIGVAGVAPEASIMPVKVLDEDLVGSDEAVINGIRWAVDHGAGVINLSVGSRIQAVTGPAFREAIEYAWSKGVICVAGAGNMYVLGSGYANEGVLVVSATDRHDGKPDYSSAVGAAKWGIAAPGGGSELGAEEDKIFSTWRGGAYHYTQGTSMAAPHVAGAVAVLRGLGLSPEETVETLLETAEDIGPRGWDATFGAGRLDLEAAVSHVARARSSGS